MFTREELLKSPEYWFEKAQNELFRQVRAFMEAEKINQTELSDRLGVSKGYVSQILNGNFNYTLKKLIEISLAIGVAPKIAYRPIQEEVTADQEKAKFSIGHPQFTAVTTDNPQINLVPSLTFFVQTNNPKEVVETLFDVSQLEAADIAA